jgi:hypothetical protein
LFKATSSPSNVSPGQWFSLGISVSSTNKTWPPQYNWNIVESGVKHHKPKPNLKTDTMYGILVCWEHVKNRVLEYACYKPF